jgi:hypothetical protein
VVDQRAALGAFFGAVDAIQAGQVSWTIRTSGRELSTSTGTLAGQWTDATAFTGSGGGVSTSSIADASQALVRWRTDTIVNGRFLQGRTFLPGISTSSILAGNLTAAAQTIINNAAATYIASLAQPVVWHRPTGGAGGSQDVVVTGTAWSELAVLRRRRG